MIYLITINDKETIERDNPKLANRIIKEAKGKGKKVVVNGEEVK